MEHVSTTPFGQRPVSARHFTGKKLAQAPIPAEVPDKWTLLRDLTTARAAFGVTDRDLVVLSALLSFHPGTDLTEGEGTIVFPSNAVLSDRTHGMAESTLRRHLAALVAAGLVIRHDSPNGKRYAARDGAGGLAVAFGFDLRPLLVRSGEITQAALATRDAARRLKRLREAVVLRLRDAAKLVEWAIGQGEEVLDLEERRAAIYRSLRRKLDPDTLQALGEESAALLEDVNGRLQCPESEEMDGNAVNSERHIQISNKLSTDSEPSQKREEAKGSARNEPPVRLPFHLVLKSCPDLLDYVPTGIRTWEDLVFAADFVRPLLGISPDAWVRARDAMGSIVAAIALACILQRATEIRSPGGYLRSLTAKAEAGAFSPGPMVMALLSGENRRAV